jgi:glyoxylase-like metal-dependent hydrolase (beta-lactamase superfamily II)
MRVHHLNCATIHTNARYPGVTHCLLIETNDELVLVDTGFGLGDYTDPTRWVRAFSALNGIPRDIEETAARQVAGLGFAPRDLRRIVLTHLHLDHAGGLPDFPWAQVHLFAPEYKAAMGPGAFSLRERLGYAPSHWAHGPNWVVHSVEGDQWFGLDCAPVIEGQSVDLLLVPLVGHTRGHCGVAVSTAKGWLLHCGDAYVRHSQVDPRHPHSPSSSWLRSLARRLFPAEPLERLQALVRHHGEEVELLCSHDPHTFHRVRGEDSIN